MGGKGVDCIRNTYHITLSEKSDIRGDAGLRDTFLFRLPNIPTLDRNETKTAIFRLKSCFVGGQTAANNLGLNDAIYVNIEGLSIRPQIFGPTDVDGQFASRFHFPNLYPNMDADLNAGGNDDYRTLISGCELQNPYECICGNPTANSELRVNVFDDFGDTISTNANGNVGALTFTLSFDIELIPPEKDQNL
tara:strand:+ start:265 stop:840 length:576 start_codon:yes stop_codon:yes gene_type:complete